MTEYFDPQEYPTCVITLTTMNGTFKEKKVAIPSEKGVVFGRISQDATDSPFVPKFASKVVSRQHAHVTHLNSKFYVRDLGSSSGTFLIHSRFGEEPFRLSEQGKESVSHELKDGDIIQLGEDYEIGGVFHKCILMKVQLPSNVNQLNTSMYSSSPSQDIGDSFESSFVDYSTDPTVKREVEEEFIQIWTSIRAPLIYFPPRSSSTSMRKSSVDVFERKPSVDLTFYPSAPSTKSSMSEITLLPNKASVISVSQSPPSTSPALVEGVDPNECITFIKSITWNSPEMSQKLISLIGSGDTNILAFYRSLKQFPSAFKDVVAKYATKKSA